MQLKYKDTKTEVEKVDVVRDNSSDVFKTLLSRRRIGGVYKLS